MKTLSAAQRRKLFLYGGIALALVIVAVILLLLLGGDRGYQQHYDKAESYFLHRDYDKALAELEEALRIQQTEEAYLLRANVYYAQGDVEEAVQVLYLGYSRVGGDAIAAMLSRLKEEQSGVHPPVTDPEDAAFVTVGGERFPADTTSVVLSNKGLSNEDLKALSSLSKLESLSLADNALSDISPLAGLSGLKTLQLSSNRLRDLSPLSGLKALKTLYLDGNPVTDFSPLYSLQSLRTLSLKEINVPKEEGAALKKALPDCRIFLDAGEVEETEEVTLGGRTFRTDVTELNLGGLNLTDITVLSRCSQLKKLDLRDNNIQDISALTELRDLEWLCLWNNKVEDLMPLMSLTQLRYLDVDTNAVTDIAVLAYLPELEEVWLNNNTLNGFDSLSGLSKLTRLGLKNTGITDGDLSLLYGLEKLRELGLEGNEALTAEAVETLKEHLDKSCTVIHGELRHTVQWGGRTFYSDATEIDASGLGIESLDGLEHFTRLERLNLSDNRLTELSPLYGLTKLRSLDLRGNPELGEAAVAALGEHLPDCEIQTDLPPEQPEETEAPQEDPSLQAERVAMGVSAALRAAGTGSGYAILWDSRDPASAPVRLGFVTEARELSMNLVFDRDLEGSVDDLAVYLSAMRAAGADIVFLALRDTDASLVIQTAKDLGYVTEFVLIY